jgi:hypothetical protein
MSSPSQRLTIWRHSQKSYKMPHMKNIYTPKKKMFKTTATFCDLEVAVGCWVLSLSTRYRDFSAIVSSAAPKKCALVDSTSKTQGFGVGDRSRKMVLSRCFDAWSRFAHHWSWRAGSGSNFEFFRCFLNFYNYFNISTVNAKLVWLNNVEVACIWSIFRGPNWSAGFQTFRQPPDGWELCRQLIENCHQNNTILFYWARSKLMHLYIVGQLPRL